MAGKSQLKGGIFYILLRLRMRSKDLTGKKDQLTLAGKRLREQLCVENSLRLRKSGPSGQNLHSGNVKQREKINFYGIRNENHL
ncbi:hypothetical protein PYX06_09225 [Citrobacter amalonaticus]|nr:hypothetical protein [Citrobacter amalonaticus]